MNTALLLEMVAEGAPDRAVVGEMTAADLLARARAAAARFLAAGVEHVALVDVNTEAVPIALFGAGLAGLPFAPVNYRLTDDQLDGILRRLTPGLVIAGPDVVDRIGDIDGLQVMSREELLAIEPV